MKKLIKKLEERNAKIRIYKKLRQPRCVIRYGESRFDINKYHTNSITLAYLVFLYLKMVSKKNHYNLILLDRYY